MAGIAKAQILVVDDDELSRGLNALHFSRVGYAVTQVSNGADALAMLAAQPYSLVLLDIDMPQMNGIEVLAEIRKLKSVLELPVIMVTANAHEASVVTALGLGANDYLVKPLNMQVAQARVRTQLSLSELARLKDEFVAFASHDLKKPLMLQEDVLRSMADAARANPQIPADVRELITLVHHSNRDMQEVVRGFLDANLGSASPSNVVEPGISMGQMIATVAETNRDYAMRKKVDLKVSAGPSLPCVLGEAFRVRQVLDNLVGNAIKFSPPNTVTEIRGSADGDSVTIEIIDGGPGLTAEDQAKLFIKGARLSNRPTGAEESTGVGLALCREIMQQVGGEIGARNNTGPGATFWARFRRHR